MNLKIASFSVPDIILSHVDRSREMQERNYDVKVHIVSTRISREELETLCEMKKYLELDSVSDLVRVALQRLSQTLGFSDEDAVEVRSR